MLYGAMKHPVGGVHNTRLHDLETSRESVTRESVSGAGVINGRPFSLKRMDSLLSDNGGVTGFCKGQSRQARLRFLFRSIKISSLEHWRQSSGKVNWIVRYFNDTIHIKRVR